MLSLILAEDHNIVRNGIRMLLEADKEISIAGEATNGLEVLEIISSGVKVDIVLADINMPEMDGITLIKELKLKSPATQIVMLSMLDNDKYVSQAFSEGASGYLLKSVSADELIFSLKHVNAGGQYLCAELAMRLLNKSISTVPLNRINDNVEYSMREIEILDLIAEGLTNNEMSAKLFISKRTIEGHRQSLIEKTGAKNTAALIRYAVLSGIIQ
ncbi:DNA-binding NarL/FixJ family response regulator [Pedobacter cryoconitis]|uniref:DNA-binding NarL/FixJ family response regulator n=1 Tax=Pedobacter cryoconitis TaxID=188932 RepID=A0A7W9DHK3_9SPHI|nr:response regulator transcription factor [Pedobacter cryoconitis]MBB5619191.1 DNA-binding NarL/FixJ family response regulator [Pedobacter cryoconitis]MBB5644486.1 DNA-binding NarL/FixJ family response regulator [Pedobacter cryoconitis]